ncbi:hypothetical protein BJ166DRAFT_596858 [Pestalotiopsis sp. NC0098]|nr:hypothetical protein BJ166DRAFT_596858 [Pestalotiopsis sp. NC0098]
MSITALPLELCGMVESYLPNRDIKNLRLVSRDFLNRFRLRLDRVFLSANTLNIEVFRSIAGHETFCHRVVEIIWDDARLQIPGDPMSLWMNSPNYIALREEWLNHAPDWYDIICGYNCSEMYHRGGCHDRAPLQADKLREQQALAELNNDESWKYYHRLLQQQKEAIRSEADVQALAYGLERFPALRRVTMTNDAHGFLLAPKYETPMIRSFPYGFNYPILQGWPARGKPSLSEPEERENAVRRLDEPHEALKQESIRRRRLRSALLQATDLEHFDIRFQVDECKEVSSLRAKHLLSLRYMLPYDRWPKLQHFGLEMAVVAHDELVSIFQELPQTLRSIRLSHLRFASEYEDEAFETLDHLTQRPAWGLLLRRIREDLDWRTRPVNRQPHISVHVPFLISHDIPTSRYVCLDEEANDFVYGDGANPFDDFETEVGKNRRVQPGVFRDALEPDFESKGIWYRS